jgi:hypothetical protein
MVLPLSSGENKNPDNAMIGVQYTQACLEESN